MLQNNIVQILIGFFPIIKKHFNTLNIYFLTNVKNFKIIQNEVFN